MTKNIYRVIAFVGLIYGSAVYAAAELVWDGSQYTGATGIDVGGALYDVSFVDGTCASLFNGCDQASDFQFDQQEAFDASSSLFTAFFEGYPSSLTMNIDYSPDLARGCDFSDNCVFFTPYSVNLEGVEHVYLANFTSLYEGIDTVRQSSATWGVQQDTTLNTVWAVWTAQSTAVPIPPSAGLFGVALAILILQRLRGIA